MAAQALRAKAAEKLAKQASTAEESAEAARARAFLRACEAEEACDVAHMVESTPRRQ